MNYHLRLYRIERTSRKLWLWELHSQNDIEQCGSSDDREEALNMATSAFDDAIREDAIKDGSFVIDREAKDGRLH